MEPIGEFKQNQKSGWGKVVIYMAIAVVSGLSSGGAVWYSMSQQNNSDKTALNAQIDEKNKSITTLESELATLGSAQPASNLSDTNTSSSVSAPNDLELMKAACASDASGINRFAYANTHSGTFGTCSLSQSYNIVKKINGNWTKVFEGNGTVDEATIDKYQIPQYIYPKQLVTLSTERTY